MRLTKRKHQTVTMQMTSMIDVTFLLLVFFMVSAAFIEDEKELDPAIKVNQPSSQSASKPLQPAMIDVLPGADGEAVYRIGGRTVRTTAELKTILAAFDNKADGAFVRVSDEAKFQAAAAAVHTAREAGYSTVTYLPGLGAGGGS